MKITAIIQARMDSERLPGKILYPLEKESKPVLVHLIERVQRAKRVDDILIVTTQDKADQIIGEYARKYNCDIWYGKSEFVLDNILKAGAHYKIEGIVDVTADCPLIDPEHIDGMVKFFNANYSRYSYVSNVINRSYPRGFDIQIYNYLTLKIFSSHIENPNHRKHSGWNIMVREDIKKQFSFVYGKNYANWRLCIDEYKDYELMKIIFDHFKNNKFSAGDVIKFLEKSPGLLSINNKVQQKVPGRG